MLDRVLGDLNPYDPAGGLRQQGAAVALPRRNIQNVPTAHQLPHEQIPMNMLVLCLALRIGGHPLAGEAERLGWQRALKNLAQNQPPVQPQRFSK